MNKRNREQVKSQRDKKRKPNITTKINNNQPRMRMVTVFATMMTPDCS